jgi:hypothetical protein
MRWATFLVMLLALALTGCRQCGERRGLFDRFRNDDDDDAPRRRLLGRRESDVRRNEECDPCRPVSRGSFGQPLLGQPVAMGNNLGSPVGGPGLGTIPGGIIYPSGPGTPIFPGSSNPDELPPPGSYQPIPATNLPTSPYAIPKATDSGRISPPRTNTFTGK